MDNDIRILIGLTDLNVDFDPKAEQSRRSKTTKQSKPLLVAGKFYALIAKHTGCQKIAQTESRTPTLHFPRKPHESR